jgi:iron complex outermembrane recepter protein
MKIYLLKLSPLRLLVLGALLFSLNIAFSQTTVKGKIIDAGTGEVLVGATVVIKGTQVGSQTDFDGLFSFKTDAKPPLTLQISFIGFETIEQVVAADTKYPLSIKLGNATKTIDVVEITGQRISEKTKTGALTVESMDRLAIKQTTGVSFYEGLSNLKGVDMTTASMGFSVINTRGFNSTSPVRSLQIIDGVDNQAPGLNFSLGNFLGSGELDVLKVDLVVGASSAFYGPNAFNGVLSMETKNPFFQKGLSASVKTGERSLTEVAIRYADAVKNKKGEDWMAFKFTGQYFKAYDWVADNYDASFASPSPTTNPGGYDAINIYGDEYQRGFDRKNTSLTGSFVGEGIFYRRGYKEVDLVDYNTRNAKANASFHFRTKPSLQEQSPEIIVSSSFGTGTTVYQGQNRFSLKDILFFQNRLEFRKKDKFFIRAYATNEDAGKTYDPYFTALLLQEKSKTTANFSADYDFYWLNNAPQVLQANGYPQATNYYDPVRMAYFLKFDTAAAAAWLTNNTDLLAQLHKKANTYAGDVKTANPFYEPGSAAFQAEFNRITSTKSSKRDLKTGGTGFYDKSALYHLHGEYKFQPSFTDEWAVGGNFRQYRPNSQGTIFYDTAGTVITNSEFGIYSGIEKKFGKNTEGGKGNKPFKFNATLRMDKNQNFNYLFSPAASLVWQPNKKDFVRLSFSSAIRNPTLNDQYLYLNVGRAILAGNKNGVKNLATIESLTDLYSRVQIDTNRVVRFNIDPIRPEQVKSFEIGYRTTLFEKTFIDASYYYSRYKDFIGFKYGVDISFNKSNSFPNDGVQAYQYAANASQTVTTQGFSIGISHYFLKYYQFSGNYSWNQLNTAREDPIIPAFNTPKNKFNLGISGRDVEIGGLKNIGFNVNYKWIEGFTYEGSPQFTGFIPGYDLLDAQVNYKMTNISTTLKIGASNVLNNKVYQVYGGPRVGRMAYISLLYEFAKK